MNFLMSLVVLPRLDFSFLAEEVWGGITIGAVAGVWSVAVALPAGTLSVVIINYRRLPALRESMDAGCTGFGVRVVLMNLSGLRREWPLVASFTTTALFLVFELSELDQETDAAGQLAAIGVRTVDTEGIGTGEITANLRPDFEPLERMIVGAKRDFGIIGIDSSPRSSDVIEPFCAHEAVELTVHVVDADEIKAIPLACANGRVTIPAHVALEDLSEALAPVVLNP